MSMATNDPAELYLTTINAQPIPDPEQQFSWARALDIEQQRFNRAIADDAAVTEIFLGCCQCIPDTDRAGRLVARALSPAANTGLTREMSGSLLDDCIHELGSCMSVSATHDPQACRDGLKNLRLRTEFMLELIAAVEMNGRNQSLPFIAAAHQMVGTIGRLTECLVLANQRLVAMLARQYRHGPLPFMDLVQEGNLGLMRAIERFDPEQGTRISTYALWWIRRAMVYAIARHGRDVRPSVAQYWEARQIARMQDILAHEVGHRATDADVAHRLGVGVDAVHRGLATLLPPVALDSPLAETESQNRLDILVVNDEKGPEACAYKSDMQRAVAALLGELPERHARILQMRFGIGVRSDCTLEQIAQQQGVTRERIRQLEAQALTALRALDSAWMLRGCLG